MYYGCLYLIPLLIVFYFCSISYLSVITYITLDYKHIFNCAVVCDGNDSLLLLLLQNRLHKDWGWKRKLKRLDLNIFLILATHSPSSWAFINSLDIDDSRARMCTCPSALARRSYPVLECYVNVQSSERTLHKPQSDNVLHCSPCHHLPANSR